MKALFLLLALALPVAAQQAGGGSGRTTGATGSGVHSFTFSPGLGTITCSGTSCSATSGSVSPSSVSVTGNLHFTSTHDANFTIGGPAGGGTGQFQVSCDSGSTWFSIAIGNGNIPNPVTYTYPTPVCSGPTNLNTLLFRAILGGGGPSTINEMFTSPSSVTVTW